MLADELASCWDECVHLRVDCLPGWDERKLLVQMEHPLVPSSFVAPSRSEATFFSSSGYLNTNFRYISATLRRSARGPCCSQPCCLGLRLGSDPGLVWISPVVAMGRPIKDGLVST
jgi:hypothetical protein